MKKRIIATIVTLSLAIALIFIAFPKEVSSEDLPLKTHDFSTKDLAMETYDFFVEEGFSSEQATSIPAMIKYSSNFDSSATSYDGNFYGLCQWGHQRLDNLKSFVEENGKDVSDFETQLQFLASELSSSNSNYQLISYNGYSPIDWETADDIRTSTESLIWTFYRPGPDIGTVLIEKQIEWAKSFEKEVNQSQKGIPV